MAEDTLNLCLDEQGSAAISFRSVGTPVPALTAIMCEQVAGPRLTEASDTDSSELRMTPVITQ